MQYNVISDKMADYAYKEIFGPARSYASEDSLKDFISEIIADLSANNEKRLFTNILKIKIEEEIKSENSLLKFVDNERYTKFENIANWLATYRPLGNNINSFVEKEEVSAKEYIINNLSKVTPIYSFCVSEGVIDDTLSEENFIKAIYSADFSGIYENSKKKTKCKFMIYILM